LGLRPEEIQPARLPAEAFREGGVLGSCCRTQLQGAKAQACPTQRFAKAGSRLHANLHRSGDELSKLMNHFCPCNAPLTTKPPEPVEPSLSNRSHSTAAEGNNTDPLHTSDEVATRTER
jgi:hypothetical protein